MRAFFELLDKLGVDYWWAAFGSEPLLGSGSTDAARPAHSAAACLRAVGHFSQPPPLRPTPPRCTEPPPASAAVPAGASMIETLHLRAPPSLRPMLCWTRRAWLRTVSVQLHSDPCSSGCMRRSVAAAPPALAPQPQRPLTVRHAVRRGLCAAQLLRRRWCLWRKSSRPPAASASCGAPHRCGRRASCSPCAAWLLRVLACAQVRDLRAQRSARPLWAPPRRAALPHSLNPLTCQPAVQAPALPARGGHQ